MGWSWTGGGEGSWNFRFGKREECYCLPFIYLSLVSKLSSVLLLVFRFRSFTSWRITFRWSSFWQTPGSTCIRWSGLSTSRRKCWLLYRLWATCPMPGTSWTGTDNCPDSGGECRIQEFQNRGARSRCGRILGVWGLLWCPFTHIFYVFVVRVQNEIYIVNIVCWLQLKKMHVIRSKFLKTNPNKFSNGGARPVHLSWIRL